VETCFIRKKKKNSPTRETLLVKDFVVDNRPIANWQTTQLEQAE
jgi:hypothetical protein